MSTKKNEAKVNAQEVIRLMAEIMVADHVGNWLSQNTEEVIRDSVARALASDRNGAPIAGMDEYMSAAGLSACIRLLKLFREIMIRNSARLSDAGIAVDYHHVSELGSPDKN